MLFRTLFLSALAVAAVVYFVPGLIGAGALLQGQTARMELVEDWENLWGRCRAAVETGASLDTSGLEWVDDPAALNANWVGQKVWRKPGSALVIVASFHPQKNLLGLCGVDVTDRETAKQELTDIMIVSAFLDEQHRLISEQTHIDRPGDIPMGVKGYKFTPRSRRPDGCQAASSILFAADEGRHIVFSSVDRARSAHNCPLF